MSNNLYSLFEQHFPESRSSIFLETENGTCYSYANLEQEVSRIASALTSLGVSKGDRVAVQVEKSPQVLFLYLACLRAGFVYLPLNTAYTENELSYFIENAEPAVVVCDPKSENIFARIAEKHPVKHIFSLDAQGKGSLISACENASDDFTTINCNHEDIAAILYTSGTTGRPKGAMISHGNLIANGLALQKTWGWQRQDVLLHALPIFHVHGLFVACHCVLLGGSKMLFIPKFDAATIMQLLPRATVMMGVPTFYTRLLDQPEFDESLCKNIRLFISGSAPLLEQTFYDFQQRSGHTILERYGMTETGMNTSNPLEGERIAGTVGFPLPGVEARIVDNNSQPVTGTDVGTLQVRGDNVFKGYWRMPDKTAEDFTSDGFFITGDLARYNEQGYIAIVGRNKDMVISGGFNVYPKEIELLLDEVEGIRESAIIGLPHKDFGEAVTAIIVPDDMQHIPSEALIIDQLKKTLAGYKVPRKIIALEQLPRNSMGKVQKNTLREQYRGLWE